MTNMEKRTVLKIRDNLVSLCVSIVMMFGYWVGLLIDVVPQLTLIIVLPAFVIWQLCNIALTSYYLKPSILAAREET
ncbi:hypothetical protein GZ77_09570 [Endozoicomonas montiporae]|uniref:Uncharacterized protein n=2 Tax=Endozoicomonas montiporae TaxID=1027273 RepID=A0A081N7Z5_9GAMM|nr:hypothetical protein EZMO1_1371 [Endozoicomonas montiporae CL-33]KEQ14568.1 hypothetical protein GZ77_09570 [Endozoicomonas montiporae]